MGEEKSNKELAELLRRFRSGECNDQERARVLKWLDALDENELVSDQNEKDEIESRLWRALNARIDDKLSRHRMLPLSRRLWPGLAAACFLGMFWMFYNVYTSKPTIGFQQATSEAVKETINTTSADMDIVLEDGSFITLRPGSKIFAADLRQGPERIVRLEGDAFFDVAHDRKRPFIVYTGLIRTLVLGTRFLIEASEHGDVKVSVSSGKVSVTKTTKDFGGTHEVFLERNQQAVFESDRKQLTATLVDDPKPVDDKSLTQAEMNFDNEPLLEILKALEETYGITIEVDADVLGRCRITTSFSHHNLFQRLDILTRAIGASYRVEGRKIVLTGTGCN